MLSLQGTLRPYNHLGMTQKERASSDDSDILYTIINLATQSIQAWKCQ